MSWNCAFCVYRTVATCEASAWILAAERTSMGGDQKWVPLPMEQKQQRHHDGRFGNPSHVLKVRLFQDSHPKVSSGCLSGVFFCANGLSLWCPFLPQTPRRVASPSPGPGSSPYVTAVGGTAPGRSWPEPGDEATDRRRSRGFGSRCCVQKGKRNGMRMSIILASHQNPGKGRLGRGKG